MKKRYITIFTLLLLFLISYAYAEDTSNITTYDKGEVAQYQPYDSTDTLVKATNNNTQQKEDLIVTTDKKTAKMGDTVKLTAKKQNNDSSPIIFKINYVTIKDKQNKSLTINPKNNQSSYDFTIPDGWRSKPVIVTAVTSINKTRVENSTTFFIEKMGIHLSDIKLERENNNVTITSTLLDEHDHLIKGSNTFIVKINDKTLKNKTNNKNMYFTTNNSKLYVSFNLDDKISRKNLTFTLVTGDRYSYLGNRTNITSIFKDKTQLQLDNIVTSNTTNITIPVTVYDSQNKSVADGKVSLYLDSKLLGSSRLINGQRDLIISRLHPGNFTIKTVYTSDNYQESVSVRNLTVTLNNHKIRTTPVASVFVRLYTNVSQLDVTKWKNSGITDVYVQAKQLTNETENLRHVINLCKDTNIKVHAWVICFRESDKFDLSTTQQDKIKKFISNVIKIDGVEGILLDYVRYSGSNPNDVNVSLITNFVKDVNNIIKSYDNNLELSAAVFPEMAANSIYYGQDYGQLSQYMDYIMPMAYKYDYNKNRTWLEDVTKYVVNRTSNAKVVTIITTYKYSTDKSNWLSLSEITDDIKAIMSAGSYGYSLFYKGAIDTYPKIF